MRLVVNRHEEGCMNNPIVIRTAAEHDFPRAFSRFAA